IEIDDKDYALWYRDLSEEMDKYIGKTVKFKGIVAYDDSFPKNTIVVGRHVMVCCEADITYRGLICKGIVVNGLKKRDWIVVTAKISKEYHEMYESEGPVLNATEVKMSKAPEQQVATFY
ncbi:MAG: GTPase, partial [Clostridia bacterium]|nr:GTPase [Clostridia bacterium]